MTRLGLVTLLLGLAVLAGGCREEPEGIPVEVLLQRATAYRRACAANELLRAARDDVELLESLPDAGGEGDANRSTASATLQFARVYHRHAELRADAYALLDSAVNHTRSGSDSTRYVQRASTFSINVPQQGSVEANVIQSYERKLSTILLDDNHRCNWDIPMLREEPGGARRG